MKRSQLREIVLEAMKGYSKYAPGGTTNGGTTADFGTILKNIALGKDQVTRGNDALDKANPNNVARISRGEKPIYEGQDEQTYIVYYRVGEDDDDDVEVKASSAAEAIEKAKAGKTAGGQTMPRLARSFSAKLK
jgi:hypothetical protein